jgi:hypothetical protein
MAEPEPKTAQRQPDHKASSIGKAAHTPSADQPSRLKSAAASQKLKAEPASDNALQSVRVGKVADVLSGGL